MQSIYPAHIRVNEDSTKTIQTCTEHSINASKYAENALANIGLGNAAKFAGIIHDMGKFKDGYKNYLEAAADGKDVHRGSVVHTFAGVKYSLNRYHGKEDDEPYKDMVSEIAAFTAGAHHGLFDCVDADHANGFLYRINNSPKDDTYAVKNFLEQCTNSKELDVLLGKAVEEFKEISEICEDEKYTDDEVMFLFGLLIRLITSAVIEGDRRDTAEFMNGAVYPKVVKRVLWKALLDKVERKLGQFTCDTPINKARKQISDKCRAFAENKSGVYRLNVPTGGGKTLSSLRYALAHAYENDKKRIIFVSPLLSILDQNSKVVREYIDDDALILEHHSNVIVDEENEKYELLKENWSAPIIITTLVQLLNTMFDGKTSSIRRFHSLAEAVIVIDEVQTVPNKMLSLFNLTVSFLAEVCGSTVILCSATQPCTEEITHPIRADVNDIIPYDEKLWSVFKRTELISAGSYRIDEIPEFALKILESIDSLLIVCNTKSTARKLFDSLHGGDYDLFHLSASMCMEHRAETLKGIYESLQSTKKTICVSTQVIEAGVDISFGAVIRLTAGMDNIIQAAGRCNRNGESDTPAPVYIVRAIDENLDHLNEIDTAKKATEQILEKYNDDLASDEAIKAYYHQLFRRQGDTYRDYTLKNTTLFRLLSDNRDWISETQDAYIFKQAFYTAGATFKVFDNDTVDVIVPYGEGKDIICELFSERAKYDIAYMKEQIEKAKGYTISVYTNQRARLKNCGALISLVEDTVYGLAEEYYNSKTGLLTNINQEVNGVCDTQIW